MAKIDSTIADIRHLDRVAELDSPIHRLDPRAKVAVTALFLATVVSFPKREIVELTALFVYPAILWAVGQVPSRALLRPILIASPFAILVGLFNPLLDRSVAVHWGTFAISGGWMSFISILVRFLLTVAAALLLLACTGYVAVCTALGRLGAPRLLVVQFLLLYRYIFVVADEASRMSRARALRSPLARSTTIKTWASLVGHLLLRAYDRGLRLHTAMLCRGFDGQFRSLRSLHWFWTDSCFLFGCTAFFFVARFGHVADRTGSLMMRIFQ